MHSRASSSLSTTYPVRPLLDPFAGAEGLRKDHDRPRSGHRGEHARVGRSPRRPGRPRKSMTSSALQRPPRVPPSVSSGRQAGASSRTRDAETASPARRRDTRRQSAADRARDRSDDRRRIRRSRAADQPAQLRFIGRCNGEQRSSIQGYSTGIAPATGGDDILERPRELQLRARIRVPQARQRAKQRFRVVARNAYHDTRRAILPARRPTACRRRTAPVFRTGAAASGAVVPARRRNVLRARRVRHAGPSLAPSAVDRARPTMRTPGAPAPHTGARRRRRATTRSDGSTTATHRARVARVTRNSRRA